MTPAELKHLISQPESVTLEFKRACPNSEVLAKLISALANTLGGRIVLGVDDDGSVVGIEDLSLARKTISKSNERIKPPVSTRIEQVEFEGKEILVIDVDKGQFPPHLVNERAYQRIGGAVVPSGSAFAPDVQGSAIQSVLGGSGAIARGVLKVVAVKDGIAVDRDISFAVGDISVAGHGLSVAGQVAGGQVTNVISYDAAFERVTGSTTFVLDQLEVSYRQTREQSQGWYRLSAIAAGVGFLLIVAGVITVIAGQLTAGVITAVAGIIPEAAAALFFVQGKEANRRVDAIQEKLGVARELLTALEIANTISNEASRNEMKRSIVIKALGLEG